MTDKKNIGWNAMTGIVAIIGTLVLTNMFTAAEEGS